MIEIQENEKDNINFLEIDDIFFENESERFYYKESIYLIHINNQNDVLILYNIIHDVNNSEIFYHYKINIKYKYSFIFNLSNNKIIGIYNKNYNKYDKGLLFNFMINEFMKKYKELKKLKNIMYKYENNIKNEIEIKAKIEEKDIGKEIYFLDDKYYDFKEEKYIFCRDHLKELNELNTELIINNKKYEYKKFFIPEKVGEYKIKLKFKIKLKDCSFMFVGCENIISIDLSSFNSKDVINMKRMFNCC